MIATALAGLFGIELPMVPAPMGAASGGRPAATVSSTGGLGLAGKGYGGRD